MKNITPILAAAALLSGCASHHVATHYAPLSVQPVTTHVQRAQVTVQKAQEANAAASTAVTEGKALAAQIAQQAPQFEPQFVQLQAKLDEVQTQLKNEHDLHLATTTELEASLSNAETLQKQVDTMTTKLNDSEDKRAKAENRADDAVHRYHRLKLMCCLLAAAIVGGLAFYLLPNLLAQYKLIAVAGASAATFAALWVFL